MKLKNKSLRYKIIGISLLLYLAACCLPAVYARPSFSYMEIRKVLWGLDCLLSGGIGCFYTSYNTWGHITWMANVFFVFAIIALSCNSSWTCLWALFAVVLSASFWSCKSLVVNEGGSIWNVYHKGIGYYMWTLSCFVVFIGGILSAYINYKDKKIALSEN